MGVVVGGCQQQGTSRRERRRPGGLASTLAQALPAGGPGGDRTWGRGALASGGMGTGTQTRPPLRRRNGVGFRAGPAPTARSAPEGIPRPHGKPFPRRSRSFKV